jgi:hypothetical protein
LLIQQEQEQEQEQQQLQQQQQHCFTWMVTYLYSSIFFEHLQRMPQKRIHLKSYTTDHKEGEQLEDRKSVGASNCNFGDGTDRRVQSLMFMMMMMMICF